jgi:CubicO group peptidase (beta-lactamase class C family)
MTRPQQSLERVDPKFPHNIYVIDQVDSSSTGEDRDREFPIMSISKSFCGAVSALMAVDGKFGSNGIDATISEALTAAISNYPERQERIGQYLQMLEGKGFGDISLSELLTHRSGIIEAKSEPAAYKDRPVLEFISEKLSMGTGRGNGAYLNSGFTLMEEIINLSSDAGDAGYENELKVRIFDKCELTKTGDLHKSEEALARVGQVALAPGMKIPMKDEVSQVFQEYGFAENEPLGRVPLVCRAKRLER